MIIEKNAAGWSYATRFNELEFLTNMPFMNENDTPLPH